MADSLLSPEEIQYRLQIVRSDGYPPPAVCSRWEELVRYCAGRDAEAAAVELIDNLKDDERIAELVRSYVMHEDESSSTNRKCTEMHAPLVLTEMTRAFPLLVGDTTGIHVTLRDGEVIDELWNDRNNREHTICAAALKAVALQTIRNRAREG